MTLSCLRRSVVALAVSSLAAALAVSAPARACTAVDLVAADGTVIAGRTMEWAFDMQWKLVSLPKGTPVVLDAPPALKLPATTVRTRYAIVGVAAGVLPGTVLIEGQNSAGMSFSGNFLPGFTRYQDVTPKDTRYVSILNFMGWALGMHGSVAELRAALPGMKVWTDPSLPTGPTPPTVHFVFLDRSGAGVVVEYVDGELRMHDNAAHVLTNAPTYDWHLANLRNYLNLTTMGVQSVRIGEVNVTTLGQGGGTVGIPGDATPPSRFVRAAFLRHHVTPPATGEQAVQAVGHVLNTVDLPLGIAQSKDGNAVVSDFTQWVAIKDLTHSRWRIADYDHRLTFVTIDLEALFALDVPTSVAVADLPYPKPGEAVKLGAGR
ncbi:MAG TPA: choloylglycine hydrolase family protein [Anaeromyxobacteraceae bacterium]|nr:choloylglycine hydrolase family protein [Anaeromyxobacteraceae bacterium]